MAATINAAVDLDEAAKAELSAMIVEVRWASVDDANLVLGSLMTPTRNMLPLARRSRRGLQDFTCVHGYLTQESWDMLRSSMPMQNKLQILLQAAQRVGLRLPTEHTMKWITCVWLYVCFDEDELVRMPTDQKLVYFRHVKSAFDTLRRGLVDPPCWVERLPPEAAEFAKDWPILFGTAFAGTSAPIAAPINMPSLLALSQSFGCRGGGKAAKSPTTTLQQLVEPRLVSSPTRRDGGSSLERMAGMMIQQMNSVAANQARMLEFVMGSSSGAGRPLMSLSWLEGRSNPQRALDDESPPSCSSARVQSPEVRAPLALMSPALTLARCPSADSQTRPSADSQTPMAVERRSANSQANVADAEDTFELLLDAMADRKAEKQALAKAEKAKAKAIAKSEAAAVASAVEHQTSEPKGDGKAKGLATSKGKARKVLGKAKAKAKAIGDGTVKMSKAPAVVAVEAAVPPRVKAPPPMKKPKAPAVVPPTVEPAPPMKRSKAPAVVAVEAAVPPGVKAPPPMKKPKAPAVVPPTVAVEEEVAPPPMKKPKAPAVAPSAVEAEEAVAPGVKAPPPMKKAKAPAVTVPPEAAVEGAVPLMLGCPKCRRRPTGCAQCRSPFYKGSRGTVA